MAARTMSIIGLLASLVLFAACTAAEATPTSVPPRATTAPPAAATATIVAPTATPTQPPIDKGGTLRIGDRINPGSLTVLKVVSGIRPGFLLYDSLLGFDEKGNLYPELAEKWEIAPDGKTITFKLRQGVKFHDGTEFNAAAVKFNIETLIKEKGFLYGDVSDVETVEAVDNLTAKVTLKGVSAPFVTAMAEQAGMMASPTAVQKYGIDEFGRNPVGAGPFAFEEWVQDDHVTLKRFEQYWDKGKPYLDKVIFKMIPDSSVRGVNLKTGNVDWISEVAYKDIAGLKSTKGLTVYEMLSNGWWRLSMQNTKPPFDNKALRQAIAYSLNMEPLAKSIFFGFTQPARGIPFNSLSWAYNPDYKGIGYDPAKARAKLAEAGKPDGFDVTLTSYSTEEYPPVAEVLQAQLKEIGIKVTPKLGAPAATTTTIMNGEFELGLSQYTGILDPDAAYAVYHSKGGYNRQRYSNPKVDELLEKARRTFDQKERKRFYDEAIPIIVEDASDIVLFYRPLLAASTDKVQNYKLMPGLYHQFETFKTVWLKR